MFSSKNNGVVPFLCSILALLYCGLFLSSASAQTPQKRAPYREAGKKTLPPEAYVTRDFKKYKCPRELTIDPGTNFTTKTGFNLVSARADLARCSNDLNTEKEKGGFCMECRYETGHVIRRSSGPNYKCWVSGSKKDEFTCEYVAPLPPSQTCNFQIQLPVLNLLPYTSHTRGDRDLHSYTGGIGGSSVELKVDAEIQRGTGPQSNALFLAVSASQTEIGGDGTAFKKEAFAIKLQDEHYVNATAAHVADCLASYGNQRPLIITPKGTIDTRNSGHEWEIIETWKRRANLIDKAECRFDTRYNDDMKRVGCRKIWFDPDFTVRLR